MCYVKINLGCSYRHIDGFVNADCRETPAADEIHDCSKLDWMEDDSASLIFSNAFFEHLYRYQHIELMRDCYRALRPGGIVAHIGMPDFEFVAGCYVNGAPGITEKIFGLNDVYRYSHGAPENTNFSYEQLHRSLLDKKYIRELYKESPFQSGYVYTYCYPNESMPLCLGFTMKKDGDITYEDLVETFKGLDGQYVSRVEEILTRCESLCR